MGGEHVQVWRFIGLGFGNYRQHHMAKVYTLAIFMPHGRQSTLCNLLWSVVLLTATTTNTTTTTTTTTILPLPPLLLLLVVISGVDFGRGTPNVKIWYDYMWLKALLNNSWGRLLVYATMLILMHLCP